MSTDTMLTFLKHCSLEEKIGFKVVTQCAPVLKGIKISNIVTVQQGMYLPIRKHLKGSRIICIPLYSEPRKEVLFLYRYDMLEIHLRKKEVRRFLERFGYLDMSVVGVIIRLRQRYARYVQGKEEFPHELGVILEYPVKDVEGFIENRGKNCLMERYWKVYHNKEQAERIFQKYDQVKEEALEEIVSGFPLCRIAVS